MKTSCRLGRVLFGTLLAFALAACGGNGTIALHPSLDGDIELDGENEAGDQDPGENEADSLDADSETTNETEANPESETDSEPQADADSDQQGDNDSDSETEASETDEKTCLASGTSCWIQGVCYAAGTANPTNACLQCLAATSKNAWSNAASTVTCSDNAACTYDDHCDGTGHCVGTAITCTSATDTCGAQRSCNGTSTCAETYPKETTTCSDNDLCTYSDHCNGAGSCVGTKITCTSSTDTCGLQRACDGTNLCASHFPDTSTSCLPPVAHALEATCDGAGKCPLKACESAWFISESQPTLCTPFVDQVAAGTDHTCALTQSGAVFCWGYNEFGQLGNGTKENSQSPVAVTGLGSGVIAIATGHMHSCALISDGTVKCWGRGKGGELGDSAWSDSSTPVTVSGLSGVVALTLGAGHSCAVLSAGSAKCWGSNYRGQLGDDSDTDSGVPVTVKGLSAVTSISAGSGHTCAVAGGMATCWGSNADGQLGNGTTTNSFTPIPVTSLLSGVAKIASASSHSCALLTSGAVKCWGYNAYGELGDGTRAARRTPVFALSPGDDLTTLISAGYFTCGINHTNGVVCWGTACAWQVEGSSAECIKPTASSFWSSGILAISGGGYYTGGHTCALRSDHLVECLGQNSYGQLGIGNLNPTLRHTVQW